MFPFNKKIVYTIGVFLAIAIFVGVYFLFGARLGLQSSRTKGLAVESEKKPDVSKPYSASWLAEAEKNIALSEYNPMLINKDSKGKSLAAPEWYLDNRVNGFHAMVGVNDWQMKFGKAGSNSYNWNLSWQNLARTDGSKNILGKITSSQITEASGTVYIDRGNAQEWYKNSEKGLMQGFTIASRPAGNGDLVIQGFLVTNLQASSSPKKIVFSGNKKKYFQYGKLSAVDSQGKSLPASISYTDKNGKKIISLIVDDSQALYPITVDPLSALPDWSVKNINDLTTYGWSVASAGDVNKDGYGDVIVGAPNYHNLRGAVFVYYGSASGLRSIPDWTVSGESDQEGFGGAVASAGDVNGDGYSDVIISAPLHQVNGKQAGAVYAYYGSADGLNLDSRNKKIGNKNWSVNGTQDGELFGWSIASAGDVNNDGYSDVIIGSIYHNNGSLQGAGEALVYYGSASGLSTSTAWSIEGIQESEGLGAVVASAGRITNGSSSSVIVSAQRLGSGGAALVFYGHDGTGLSLTPDWTAVSDQSSEFSSSIACAGDVNGDGYDDIAIGDDAYSSGGLTGNGAVHVYYGSSSGLSNAPAWTVYGDQSHDYFGSSIASAGDLNGDGYSDFAIGAINYNNSAGAVYAYYGSSGGLSTSSNWSVVYDQPGNSGAVVASAGDINKDGYDELIVGNLGYMNADGFSGSAFIYNGSASGLSSVTPDWIGENNNEILGFGASAVASAGDVNGDGYNDVIIGAYNYDSYTGAGAAFVYYGTPTGLPDLPDWTAYGDQNFDQVSDGLGEFFGSSVGTAGDVNGDGYSDVIIGAPLYSYNGNQAGAVFAYYGSANGLSSSPDWVVYGDRPNNGGTYIDGGYGEYLGGTISMAGDVNGDGYSDVLIGAQWYDTDTLSQTGAAFVYNGSAGGLLAAPSWSVIGTQNHENLGAYLAVAGDVNGDGYGDIAVTSYNHSGGGLTSNGAAYLYQGSSSGLATTAAWSVYGSENNEMLGNAISSAGDVNGDGYSDLIVGSYNYIVGSNKVGAAFVYNGSQNGLSTTSAETLVGTQAGEQFGFSVSLAGDVNNDGYSNVIIGSLLHSGAVNNSGAAFMYNGSGGGVSLSPSWTTAGDQRRDYYGWTVSNINNIKGDNRPAVFVDAADYSTDINKLNQSGKVFAYYSSGGPSRDLAVTQFDIHGNPLVIGGTISTSTLQIALTGKAPVGRTMVKTWYEVKPSGVAFNGANVIETDKWIDTGFGGGTVTTTISGLENNKNYHWRARWQYLPSLDFTPWYAVGGNAIGTVDFATLFSYSYSLNYTAGANGLIIGTSSQIVNKSANGSAVTAVPDNGYYFVQWSDGSAVNPRTDLNIINNIAVTAEFALIVAPAAPVNVTPSGNTSQNSGYITPPPAKLNLVIGLNGGAVNTPLFGDGVINQINLSDNRVNLKFNLTGVSYYSFAYTSDFTNRSFVPYTGTTSFVLLDKNGSYPVYLKFRLADNTNSQIYSLLFNLNLPAVSQVPPQTVPVVNFSAETVKRIVNHVSGYILLQVQSHGEAWYIDPISKMRVSLSNGSAVDQMIRIFGLGISDANLIKLQNGDKGLLSRLKGRIVLQVQSLGQAYYINPSNNKVYFIKSGAAALKILASLGLGISDFNLGAIMQK
jgi:hypothetical protein